MTGIIDLSERQAKKKARLKRALELTTDPIGDQAVLL
jgi:hypothetical protein